VKSPKFLYSTNTTLAYKINVQYYNDIHYVWCSPNFGSSKLTPGISMNPPSSRPLAIYHRLLDDVDNGDTHSDAISRNKIGLQRGAEVKLSKGIITKSQQDEILYMVSNAPIIEFKPLIYTIHYNDVKGLVREVPIAYKANPTAIEFLIEELPGTEFEPIEFSKS